MIIILKRGYASSHERGLRWFVIWNLKLKRRETAILCRCGKTLKVTPKKDCYVNFSHKCGMKAEIFLEGLVA